MRLRSLLAPVLSAALVASVQGCDLRAHAEQPKSSPAGAPTQGAPVSSVPPASPSGQPGAQQGSSDKVMGPMPSLAPLVKQLRPAVVNVYTTQNARPRRGRPQRGIPNTPQQPDEGDEWNDFFDRFFGGGGGDGRSPQEDMRRQALGSGFLIGEGMALTNNHVVEGADEIKVRLADTREFDAKVVGRDPSTDVALLQLQGDGVKQLPAVRMGDSDAIDVGDYVVAIGNPFGLNLTVTSGIVSAKERVIGAGPYDDFIQTDASINPGNSGGPLFNLRGEVVAINTAIVARGQGIGFAVPVNLVKDLLPQLREKGRVSRGYLGVGIQSLTPELQHSLGLPSQKGALIAQVVPNGPAARAGLQNGDVVLELNGKPVDSSGALSRGVAAVAPGGTAHLKVLRDGKERMVDVKVVERDEESLASGQQPSGGGENDRHGGAAVGLSVTPVTPDLARRLGVSEGEGLIVTDVQDGSAAEAAGVQQGDVLLELQRKPMSSVDAFRKTAREVKPGDTVLFRIRRGGSALYLAAKAPKK